MNYTQSPDFLQAALGYAALGYAVFPCVPGEKRPLTPNGFKDASCDAEQIRQWWLERPDANIGMPTAGLLVVDVDPGGKDWEELPRLNGGEGPVQQTPRGGSHHFFRDENHQFRNTTGKLATGVDTRATGGYVVVAPSVITQHGASYVWQVDLVAPDGLPPVPEWLGETLCRTTNTPATEVTGEENGQTWAEGQRNTQLFSMAAKLRANGLSTEGILDGLSALNTTLCTPPLEEEEVAGIVRSVSGYDRGELLSPRIGGRLVQQYFANDSPNGSNGSNGSNGAQTTGVSNSKIDYQPITAAELAHQEYHIDWMVDYLLAAGQPAILSGPKKVLKTSIALDLGISLASGEPFLGEFNVPKVRRVAFMSGESGLPVLQETLFRICRSKAIDARDLDHLLVTERLPMIGDLHHWTAMGELIDEHELELVIIDPAYLAMSDADFGNLFHVGQRLRMLSDLTTETGCGFLLLHHARKRTGDDKFVMPELDHIAWAGFQEWARQWVLLNRRETFEPGSGMHRLWLSYGGSVGHSGAWALRIEEGVQGPETTRHWDVEVKPVAEVHDEQKDRQDAIKAERQQERAEKDAEKIFEALGEHRGGLTKNRLRECCGLSSAKVTAAIEHALDFEWIVPTTIPSKSRKTPYEGYVRHPELLNADSPHGAHGPLGIIDPEAYPD